MGGLASPPKTMHLWVLYCLLAIQLSYIVIDFLLYHQDTSKSVLACMCHCPAASAKPSTSSPFSPFATFSSSMAQATTSKLAIDCESREGHYDVDEGEKHSGPQRSERTEADPWHQMKWVGQPASCTVKGLLIEKLDESHNFRRGYALKHADDVEDKTHLLPWLLGARVDLNRRSRRRVYVDLGANRFSTSVKWFMRMYPCDFTEVHAFEANARSWRAPRGGFDEAANVLEGEGEGTSRSVRVKQTPGIPQWMLDRIKVHYQVVADEDDEAQRRVNITRFLKEELGLRAQDTVVVKMDIEGGEWPILRRWMKDPDMPLIVDELFVELHYAHPTMSAFGWDAFRSSATRHHARRLLADLRWRGFYAHAWP